MASITDGLHRGATVLSRPGQALVVGSADGCDLVLLDDGVAPQALSLFERAGGLVADVRCSRVRHAGRLLPLGLRAFNDDVAELRVGDAEMRIELMQPARRQSAGVPVGPSPTRAGPRVHRGAWAALAGAAVIVAGALVVAGGAVNASSRVASSRAGSLERLVDAFNAQGARIAIVQRAGGIAMLRGLVADDPMREQLERELQSAGLQAELQLHDVRRMGESLERLALLAGHPCDARHVADGRFECDAGVAAPQVVQRLRALAEQVPGVVAFDVTARAPAAPPKPPEPVVVQVQAPPPPEPPPAPWPQIRHVVLGSSGSFVIDTQGRKLRVGDIVDGARVQQIRFDAVDFVRTNQRHTAIVMPTEGLAVSVAPGRQP